MIADNMLGCCLEKEETVYDQDNQRKHHWEDIESIWGGKWDEKIVLGMETLNTVLKKKKSRVWGWGLCQPPLG